MLIPTTGVVVPIRAFSLGKTRLTEQLTLEARVELAAQLADRIVDAAGSLPIVVVSSALEVRNWAQTRELVVIDDPGSLNAAAGAGRSHLAAAGCRRVVVAHADLPYARTLDALTTDGGELVVALVPCHREDGTTVLSVPVDAPFRYAYGPGSFRRHVAEAHRLDLEVRVVRDPDLAFDIDLPSDLEIWTQSRSRSLDAGIPGAALRAARLL